MFFKVIAVLVLFWGMLACAAGSVLIGNRMLDEVNARLPPSERFFWLGWDTGKHFRLWQEYRRLGLSRASLVWQGILGVVMAVCVWLIAGLLSTGVGH
jgi:hypothetical protein